MTHFAYVLAVVAAALPFTSGASLVPAVEDMPLHVGSALHLDCGVQGHYRYCLWEAEDGRVFQVEDVLAGRHVGLKTPHNLTYNQCGIVVEQAAARDAGRWTCRVFLQGKVLTAVRNVHKEPKACNGPFEAVGTGCFYIEPSLKLIWEDARAFCQSLSPNADLAVVDDCYQLELIWGHIIVNYGPTEVWLGATNKYEDKVWRWLDRTNVPMGTPFWGPSEPNNLGGQERCLSIARSTGYFNDLSCSTDFVSVMCRNWSSWIPSSIYEHK